MSVALLCTAPAKAVEYFSEFADPKPVEESLCRAWLKKRCCVSQERHGGQSIGQDDQGDVKEVTDLQKAFGVLNSGLICLLLELACLHNIVSEF